jgi:hypothetical protein
LARHPGSWSTASQLQQLSFTLGYIKYHT